MRRWPGKAAALTWKSKVVGPMHPEFMMQLEDLGIRRA
jgi:hypothetical protein